MKEKYHPDKTLREVCREYGVSRRAVQGYEKMGLVAPTGKTLRGYNLYDESAQSRIAQIKTLQDLGFSLREAGVYLSSGRDIRIQMLIEKLGELEYLAKKTEHLIEYIKVLIKQQ